MRALLCTLLVLWPVSRPEQVQGAQETGVIGRVVESETGIPIPGVMVGLVDSDAHVMTDAEGGFHLPGVSVGTHRVVIDQLGYEPLDAEIAFGTGVRTIPLVVRPVSLDEIEVEVRRLEARRQHLAERSEVFTAEDLEARLQDPAAFLRGRGQIRPVPCAHPTGCVRARGQTIALIIFIDDNAIPAAMEYLGTYPPELIARIETYPNCGMIRIYSKRHLERLAKIGGRVQSIACIKLRVR